MDYMGPRSKAVIHKFQCTSFQFEDQVQTDVSELQRYNFECKNYGSDLPRNPLQRHLSNRLGTPVLKMDTVEGLKGQSISVFCTIHTKRVETSIDEPDYIVHRLCIEYDYDRRYEEEF